MRIIRYIITFIITLSIICCFGFSVLTSMPDGVWDGKTKMDNNRSYILKDKVTLTEDTVIPENSMLILEEFGEIVVPKNTALTIKGILKIHKGGGVTNYGNVYITKSGSLEAMGNFLSEAESSTEIRGIAAVGQTGNIHIKSNFLIEEKAYLENNGYVFLKADGVLDIYGEMSLMDSGSFINSGKLNVYETGLFESFGNLENERKGIIANYGRISLNSESILNSVGKITNLHNGILKDNSTHKDLSIYTADILEKEEEVIKRGIDISWVQGEVDWETLSQAGIDFVMIRCGRGDIDGTGPKEDNQFIRNIEAANKYGIDAGVYFYSYALNAEQAAEEAEFALSLLRGHTLTYPVVVDIEEDIQKRDLTDIAEAFMETIAEGGYYPMLYSYMNMMNTRFSDELKEKYAIWVARLKYTPETDYDYQIWQYSHDGEIAGISGKVDFDIAYRDFPAILRYYGLNHLPPADNNLQ